MEKPSADLPAVIACALLGAGLAAPITAMCAGPTPAQIDEWGAPRAPFKIYGNTYYVGTKGITSILVTSDYGHTLIDGGTAEAVPQITRNIEVLGFRPTDIKAILNTHAHWDHAAGLSALQTLTGAPVYLRRPSEEVLRTGRLTRGDPQYGLKAPAIPPVKSIWIVSDEQLLGVGSNRFKVLATPGHTPGGTTWTWDACEKDKCRHIVYADSLSPVSAERFKFSASKDYPDALADFELSFSRLESMPCDVLLTPHPEQSQLFERATQGVGGCKDYVQAARARLAERLATEKR
ncbi:MAG: beta-lactamase class [Pseudomonadota bacterium]|jgi:metallo-beta-lactamase class B